MLLCFPILSIITSSLSLKCDIDAKFAHRRPIISFVRPSIPFRVSYTSSHLIKEDPKNVNKVYSVSSGFNSLTKIFGIKEKSDLLRKIPIIRTAISLNKYPITSEVISKVFYAACTYLISESKALADYIKLLYLKTCNIPIADILNLYDNPIPVLIRLNFMIFLADILSKGYVSRIFKLDGDSVFISGELYRVMTSLFVHSSIAHLVVNMVSLSSIEGKNIRIFGPKRLLVIYLISGIVANYISYLCNYAHENGIPANLIHILTTAASNLGIYKHSLVRTSDPVIDEILRTERTKCFIRFLIDYVTTSLEMALHSIISGILVFFGDFLPPKVTPEIEKHFKRFCKRKFRKSFIACGASGAIYGLYGAILAHDIRFGQTQKPERLYEVLLPLILPHIAKPFNNNIDHYSHTVGFLAGAFLATLID